MLVTAANKSFNGKFSAKIVGLDGLSINEEIETPVVNLNGHKFSVIVGYKSSTERPLTWIKYHGNKHVRVFLKISFDGDINYKGVFGDDFVDLSRDKKFTEPIKDWEGADNEVYRMNSMNDHILNVELRIFTVKFEVTAQVTVVSPLHHSSSLRNDTNRMFKTLNTTSDITLMVSDVALPCHKFILSLRSPVFKAMLTSGLSESTSNEIVIPDFEADAVREFIQYLYLDECSAEGLDNCADQLLMLAHRYQVDGLFILSESALICSVNATNMTHLLQIADTYGCEALKKECENYFYSHSKEMYGLMCAMSLGVNHNTSGLKQKGTKREGVAKCCVIC